MLPVAPELAARIQRRIDELEPASPGDWPVRVCKEELNSLPLHSNSIYIWAIRPDGTVLCMDYEAFAHPTEPETNALALYAVMVHGARRYPELQEVVPAPPAGARPCGTCGGTGRDGEEAGAHGSCLGCSGLGWNAPRWG